MKEYLGLAPVLSKPIASETLSIYLAVSERVTSIALVWDAEGVQKPVYYVSKALTGAECRYPAAEKVALALVVAARKLRPYF